MLNRSSAFLVQADYHLARDGQASSAIERGGSTLTKRIGRLDYAVYGPRKCAADRLPWIGYEEGLRHLPQARWIAAAADGSQPAPLSVNDAEAIVQAIHAGLGKSLLPCCVGDRDGHLARLVPKVVLSREVWLLMTHRELRHQRRIDAAIAWLKDLFCDFALTRQHSS